MKFFIAVVLFVALVAASLADHAPDSGSSHCDYDCSQGNLPTCVYNGRCYLQLPNLCALQKYNCLNPQKAFHQVDQFKCKEDSAPQCQNGDY